MIIMSAQPSSPATIQKFRLRFIVGEWALKSTKHFSKSKPFSNRKLLLRAEIPSHVFVVFMSQITLSYHMVAVKLFCEFLLIE